MERRMIIEGEKIQHVGYRPFLLTEVLRHKEITNFQADNIRENGKKKNGKTQKVIISMVGEEQNISDFAEFIKNNFPDYAKNCRVVLEEDKCTSKVMTINDFRDVLAVEQQSTMVQAGLELKEGMIILGEKIDTGFNKMDENFHDLGDKIDTGFNKMDENFKGLGEKIDTGFNKMDENFHDLGDKIDTGFNKMDENFHDLGDKIDTGFGKMDENFKGLDTKYKLISEGMFAVVNELKEANKTLGERLEKSEKNIERLLEILEKRTK